MRADAEAQRDGGPLKRIKKGDRNVKAEDPDDVHLEMALGSLEPPFTFKVSLEQARSPKRPSFSAHLTCHLYRKTAKKTS